MTDTKKIQGGEVVIYRSKDGKAELEVKLQQETVWLTQKMLAELFDCSIDNASLHLKNIFKERELDEKSVVEEFSITARDGKTYKTKHYNLDAIIALGYRVNSKRATQFRIWATSILKDHLLKGFTLNQKRLSESGLQEFEQAVALIRRTIESKALTGRAFS